MDAERTSVPVELDLFSMWCTGKIPTSPKQFELVKIKAKMACELNRKWHSRLPKIDWSNVVRNTHYICYGFRFDGRWYAVGIWSSPVAQNRFKDGRAMLELRRLAICSESPQNTATRMISMMIKDITVRFLDINRLISYQDTEVHLGTIYKASNWVVGGKSAGIPWSTENRIRNVEQSLARKVRWEHPIKRRKTQSEG